MSFVWRKVVDDRCPKTGKPIWGDTCTHCEFNRQRIIVDKPDKPFKISVMCFYEKEE